MHGMKAAWKSLEGAAIELLELGGIPVIDQTIHYATDVLFRLANLMEPAEPPVASWIVIIEKISENDRLLDGLLTERAQWAYNATLGCYAPR